MLEGGEMREDKEEVKMIKVLYACAHMYSQNTQWTKILNLA